MGHLAALCIGIPESSLIADTWNLGLVGMYISGVTGIFYSYSWMRLRFSSVDIFGMSLPMMAVTLSKKSSSRCQKLVY